MLRWLYFTLVALSISWGLLGAATRYLIQPGALLTSTLALGIPIGLFLTLFPWRKLTFRVFLFGIWPLGVATAFFSLSGTFNFLEVRYVEIFNFEFALLWGGALWALIVFTAGRRKVFEKVRAPGHSWQRPLDEKELAPAYFLPDTNLDDEIGRVRESSGWGKDGDGTTPEEAGAPESWRTLGDVLEERDTGGGDVAK